MIATLKDIAKVLVAKHQLKQRDAEGFVNAIVDTVLEGLQADRIVKIKGFGTFKLTAVRDRESVNVNTGERIIVNGHDKISFTPDSVMRDMVNKPFAQFDTVVIGDGVSFDDMQEETEDAPEAVDTIADDVVIVQDDKVVPADTIQIEEEKAESVIEELSDNNIEAPDSDVETSEDNRETPESNVEPSEDNIETPESNVEPVVEEAIAESESKVDEIIDNIIEDKVEPETVIEEEERTDMVENKQQDEQKIKVAETPRKAPVLNEHGFIIEPEDDDDAEEESHCKKIFIVYAVVTNILIAALAFVMGYMCCSNGWLKFGPERVPEQEPEEVVLDSAEMERVAKIDSIRNAAMGNATKSDSVEKKPAAKETISPEKQNTEQKSVEQKSVEKKVAEPQKPAEAQKKDSKVAANIPNQSAYEKDVRVRTGAYYIIGTQETVKVRAGQTLKSISKFYLGDGMECYIEVYNGGIKDVSEGQTIKIPKLQLKKKTAKL